MAKLEDHEHGRQTVFEPPLVMYPASMGPGTVFKHETRLKSGDIHGHGEKRGSAICETTFIEDGRLQSSMVFRLAPAVVKRTTVWTLDATGRILQEDERRTLHVGPLRIENEHVVIRLPETVP